MYQITNISYEVLSSKDYKANIASISSTLDSQEVDIKYLISIINSYSSRE